MFERPLLKSSILATITLLAVAATAQQDNEPDGAALYARHCASCHGTFGEGDGPVAEVMQSAIPDLRSLRRRSDGTFPREAVIGYIDGRDMPAAHGARLMPVWGDTFADDGDDNDAAARIAAITDFVERLQN